VVYGLSDAALLLDGYNPGSAWTALMLSPDMDQLEGGNHENGTMTSAGPLQHVIASSVAARSVLFHVEHRCENRFFQFQGPRGGHVVAAANRNATDEQGLGAVARAWGARTGHLYGSARRVAAELLPFSRRIHDIAVTKTKGSGYGTESRPTPGDDTAAGGRRTEIVTWQSFLPRRWYGLDPTTGKVCVHHHRTQVEEPQANLMALHNNGIEVDMRDDQTQNEDEYEDRIEED